MLNTTVNITINDKKFEVENGITILEAAKRANIHIPTLCHFEGKKPIGACRICLVEVKGAKDPVAACSTPVGENMQISTRGRELRLARKGVIELLLSEHNGECPTCSRNSDCELKALAEEHGVKDLPYSGEKKGGKIDDTTWGLYRDSSKCIHCRRCIEVCNGVQGVSSISAQFRGFKTQIGPAFAADLDEVTCVQCGQCAAVCPVGAISEQSEIESVLSELENPKKYVVVQTAPAVRVALGEEFSYPVGTSVTGKMVSALKELGFNAVFDTNFTADLTIIEEGTELLTRLKDSIVDKKDKKSPALPMFTSCSPGWIQYVEHFYPDFIKNISTCKSPQQMFGALAKTYYANKIGVNPADMVVVSIMPCTAKKAEARREEMFSSGYQDVDYVLTTRELARMIKQSSIDFQSLPDSQMDSPLGFSSGAADIFGNSGGVMEAAIRTAYELVTGKELPVKNLHLAEVAGLKGIKEASLTITGCKDEWKFFENVTLKVAVAHGLENAKELIEKIKKGDLSYHFIEVMTCPGGCIGGGGQPRFTDNHTREKRIAALYREDEGKKIRKSHDNPDIEKLYKEFLGKPLGNLSHKLLHTHYHKRERV
ncbi:MAG: iron hydrogenase small subunit [Oligoflexia bacterium]|nr:iron hydrogenase small subunit [Oligoflexia bacterium]